MKILSVDPGLADAAATGFHGQEIVEHWSWTTQSSGPRPSFSNVVCRAQYMADQFRAAVESFHPDQVAIEGYGDFGGGVKRTVSLRWTTPLVVGCLSMVLRDHPDIKVFYQPPEVVLPAYAQARGMWKARKFGLIVPGDERLTNEHLRSAGAHGLYALAMAGRR